MSDVLPAPTRLDVVERPTWFGPAESPLFGVAHLPADQKVRGAVLICGSLGKDHADALRGLRLLGDQLAALGMLVFRFDYLGTGDSSYGQVRPDSVREWQDSIAHALDYLHGAGITDVSAIAVRAGCVILDDCLSRTSSISRIVYWDPVGTGQRFLREQTAFFKITVGEDNVPPGLVSMIGTRLSAEAAREFAAMGLDETGPPAIGWCSPARRVTTSGSRPSSRPPVPKPSWSTGSHSASSRRSSWSRSLWRPSTRPPTGSTSRCRRNASRPHSS